MSDLVSDLARSRVVRSLALYPPRPASFAARAAQFGDFSKSALKSVTGKEQYKFGDITKSIFRRVAGGGGNERQGDADEDKDQRASG